MTNELKEEKVIPEVIDDFTPENELKVSWGNTTLDKKGKILTPTQVQNRPKVEYKAEEGYYYTLVMTDPDAPSRKEPKFREWVHWVVTNIEGNDWKKGDELKQYIGAGPPEGTNLHRYVILLFKHKEKIDFKDEKRLTNKSGNDRGKWNVRKFTEKFNLGKPVAVTFFKAEFDDYVPKLYKQLSG